MKVAVKDSPKEIRDKLGLSQVEMAVKADVALATIQRFEIGRLSPSLASLRKLASAYGLTLEEAERFCASA